MVPLMSLACKSWNLIIMGGLKQASPTNTIFLFTAKVKAHWRIILTHCLKNWMQKNDLSNIHHEKNEHILWWNDPYHTKYVVHLLAIGIKWCPSWNPLYLLILTMVLTSTTTPVGRLMTLEATVSHIKSITTTSVTKT
jgi:hypothetical protein